MYRGIVHLLLQWDYIACTVVSCIGYAVGSSFQMSSAAAEKARLSRFTLVLGIISCCEVNYMSCNNQWTVSIDPI